MGERGVNHHCVLRCLLLLTLLAAGMEARPALCAGPEATVTAVRVGISPGTTRVVFDLSAPVRFSRELLDGPARIVVSLADAGTALPPDALPIQGTPISLVQVAAAPDGGLRYTFFLDREVSTDLFILKPYQGRGDRLVLDIHSGEAPPTPSPVRAAPPPPANGAATVEAQGVIAAGQRPTVAVTRRETSPAAGNDRDYSGEWSGYVSLDARLFVNSPAYPKQDDQNASAALRPEYYADWANGTQRLAFVPFYRYDANDAKRTHADIRELYWQIDHGQLSFKAGIDVVFWGVAESQHLVDIINQTDLVENLDGEEKLGQPMLNLDYLGDLGTWQLYLLPYFRERTFPGQQGRLRNDPPVDRSDAFYESGDKQEHLDFALRWSRSIGDWDIGLGHFSGTGREAALLPSSARPKPALAPFYPQIDQTSLDAQATTGAWLWKLEAIYNQNNFDDYYAWVAGFEYTRFGVAGSDSDLGWLFEYHYDQRGDRYGDELIPTALQDDIYLGLRWTGNDIPGTRLLLGVLIDFDTGSTFGNLEYSRRLGEQWTLGVEARILGNIDRDDLFYPIRQDDYIGIEFTRWY